MASQLKITPVGINGAFTLRGLNTSYLVSKNGKDFLFDCGTTAGVALFKAGRSLVDVSEVYISHLHLDHVGGLFQLGLSRYSAGLPRPKLYASSDLAQKIWPLFLQTFMEFVLGHSGEIEQFGPESFFEVIEIPDQNEKLEASFQIGDITCVPIEFSHPSKSKVVGLVLDEKALLTADTIFLPSVLESVANRFRIEAIFHDCTFNPALQKLHATIEELASLPEDLRELILLSHYEDQLPTNERIPFELAEVGRTYTF
jgi:hydroxyacylglutathione hydrolase